MRFPTQLCQVSLLISIIVGLPNQVLANCTGAACADLRVQVGGECVTLANQNPQRSIRVSGSNWVPAYVFHVPANGSLIPRDYNGICYNNWYNKWIAEYQ